MVENEENKTVVMLHLDARRKKYSAISAFRCNETRTNRIRYQHIILFAGRVEAVDSSEFILKSRSVILKRLGFCADHNNLRRLNKSLAFWSVATLSFEFWFYPQKILKSGRIKHRRTGPQKLPPPFKVIDRGKGLSVTISATWLELGPHYSQMTPLPLPRTAAAQNLVLCLLVSIKDNEPRRIRELCRKIGLNHRTRGYVLDNALECARTYYATHNGDLYWKKNGRTITFAITQPEKPTVKRASVKENSAIELEPRKQEAPKRKPSSPKNRSRLELLPTQHKQTELQIEEVQDGWRDETGRAYQMYKLSDNRLVDADELIQLGLGDRV